MGDDDNNNTLKQVVQLTCASYEADPCGICESTGGDRGHDVFWFSTTSRTAHRKCFKQLKDATKEAEDMLDKYCSKYNRADTHIKLVNLVRERINMPLRCYAELCGTKNLKPRFLTAAKEVIGKLIEKKKRKKREKKFIDVLLQRIKSSLNKT